MVEVVAGILQIFQPQVSESLLNIFELISDEGYHDFEAGPDET